MTERLDRESVERILARAHAIEPADRSDDPGLEPQALIAAAADVGIDPDAVRDSLAIERFSVVVPERRRLDGLVGAADVFVERDVSLTVDEALDGIETWLTAVHRLTCDRRGDGSLRARRRTDASARVGRTIAGWRGDGRLGTIGSIDVEVVPQIVGSTPARSRSLVRIRADRHETRIVRLGGGAGLAGTGTAAGLVVLAGASPWGPVIVAPFVAVPFLAGGYVLARTGRGHADRLALELERLVTFVDRRQRPTGLLGRAWRSARRVRSSR